MGSTRPKGGQQLKNDSSRCPLASTYMHIYVHPRNMNMCTHMQEEKAREGKGRGEDGTEGEGRFTGIYHKGTKRRAYFAVFIAINKGMSKISGDRILSKLFRTKRRAL